MESTQNKLQQPNNQHSSTLVESHAHVASSQADLSVHELLKLKSREQLSRRKSQCSIKENSSTLELSLVATKDLAIEQSAQNKDRESANGDMEFLRGDSGALPQTSLPQTESMPQKISLAHNVRDSLESASLVAQDSAGQGGSVTILHNDLSVRSPEDKILVNSDQNGSSTQEVLAFQCIPCSNIHTQDAPARVTYQALKEQSVEFSHISTDLQTPSLPITSSKQVNMPQYEQPFEICAATSRQQLPSKTQESASSKQGLTMASSEEYALDSKEVVTSDSIIVDTGCFDDGVLDTKNQSNTVAISSSKSSSQQSLTSCELVGGVTVLTQPQDSFVQGQLELMQVKSNLFALTQDKLQHKTTLPPQRGGLKDQPFACNHLKENDKSLEQLRSIAAKEPRTNQEVASSRVVTTNEKDGGGARVTSAPKGRGNITGKSLAQGEDFAPCEESLDESRALSTLKENDSLAYSDLNSVQGKKQSSKGGKRKDKSKASKETKAGKCVKKEHLNLDAGGQSGSEQGKLNEALARSKAGSLTKESMDSSKVRTVKQSGNSSLAQDLAINGVSQARQDALLSAENLNDHQAVALGQEINVDKKQGARAQVSRNQKNKTTQDFKPTAGQAPEVDASLVNANLTQTESDSLAQVATSAHPSTVTTTSPSTATTSTPKPVEKSVSSSKRTAKSTKTKIKAQATTTSTTSQDSVTLESLPKDSVVSETHAQNLEAPHETEILEQSTMDKSSLEESSLQAKVSENAIGNDADYQGESIKSSGQDTKSSDQGQESKVDVVQGATKEEGVQAKSTLTQNAFDKLSQPQTLLSQQAQLSQKEQGVSPNRLSDVKGAGAVLGFGWEQLRAPQRVTYQDVDPRYLELLSTKYPNRVAVFSEIINLQAILNLPKGTEHFVSDIHGEYEAFRHILNNCSGVIKEKVDLLFTELSAEKKADLCTLIYYPKEVLKSLEDKGQLTDTWYREVLSYLIRLCKYLSAKYTRSKVRKAVNREYAYIIDELLHAQEGESNSRALYHSKIIDTILHIRSGHHFVNSLCALSKRLAVDHLHVVGDIFDRGAEPDKVMALLMDYHSLDIQWGNHDILWMGAACGSEACMATVLRNNINYFNCDLLESAYGISLRKLNDFAQKTYTGPIKGGVQSAAQANANVDAKANVASLAQKGTIADAVLSDSTSRVVQSSICMPTFNIRANLEYIPLESKITYIHNSLGYAERKLAELCSYHLDLVYQYAVHFVERCSGHKDIADELLKGLQVETNKLETTKYFEKIIPSSNVSGTVQADPFADASHATAEALLQAHDARSKKGKRKAKASGQEPLVATSSATNQDGAQCQSALEAGAITTQSASATFGAVSKSVDTGSTTLVSAPCKTSLNAVDSDVQSNGTCEKAHSATASKVQLDQDAQINRLEFSAHAKKFKHGIKLKALVSFLERESVIRCQGGLLSCEETKLHTDSSQERKEKMVKAITVIALKLQGQLIMRNPEFKMDDRLLLNKIDFSKGTVMLGNQEYAMNTMDLPTIDPNDPFALSKEEAEVMASLKTSFINSRELQREVGFLFSHGSIYKRFNGNLLYHGCIPMTESGEFKPINCHGQYLAGKALLDYCDSVARRAYAKRDENSLDFMYFLWCGVNSPLSGRIMKPFERYFIDDKTSHVEPRDPYYSFYYQEDICRKVLEEFGLDPDRGHIINGHTPIKVKHGESPIRGNGKLFVIDGGLCEAYHETTGIAGYTLISSSHGMVLQAHRPFENTEKAIEHKLDIVSVSQEVEHYRQRMLVADSDTGIKLKRAIFELEALLDAYRQGLLPEIQNRS